MNSAETIAVFPSGHLNEVHTLDALTTQLQLFFPVLSAPQLKWAEFSERSINEFIQKEKRYGSSGLTPEGSTPFSQLSSGEKRRVLLEELLSSKPDVLLMVSPLESLDPQNREHFRNRLQAISEHCYIIQLLYRSAFILPWTSRNFRFEEGTGLKEISKKPKTDTSERSLPDLNTLPEAAVEGTAHLYPSLVKMEGLSLFYQDRCILKDIHWEVKSNEFWELSGPNGSGKSSLITLITGDNHKAYHQPLSLFGRPRGSGESVWDIKSKIGYFTPSQLQGFGGYQNALELLISGYYDSVGLYQLPSDRQARIAREWLNVLQIDPNKRFRALSQGQQRLLMTVRAFLKQPPLLILDEPTWGLDPGQVALFVGLVNQLFAASNCGLIYVSHHPEAGLKPTHQIQLIPHEEGSTALIS